MLTADGTRAAGLAATEAELIAWRDHHAQRDAMLRRAHAAGVNKHRIHLLTGIARTTIDRVLSSADA